MPRPVKIDFVSDVACPWCAIGLAALERAMADIGNDLQVELRFQPFELNPDMGPQGESIAEHLGRKYGLSAEQLAQNGEALRQRGEALGDQCVRLFVGQRDRGGVGLDAYIDRGAGVNSHHAAPRSACNIDHTGAQALKFGGHFHGAAVTA